jgi:RNA polymerase primary sigma factor
MRTQSADDHVRIAALTSGDPSLAPHVLKRIAPTVWTACLLLTGEEAEAREAFRDVTAKLAAGNFARLRDYTGKGTLETFIALTARDLLSERMLQILRADREKGWRAFEKLFEADFHRLIRKRLTGAGLEEERREAYQVISLAMIDEDCHRLKAYDGSGSFSGFVLRTADRLLIDFLRGLAKRRRLPHAIARLPALEREIFKLVRWDNLPERPEILAPHLATRLDSPPTLAEIAAALARVEAQAETLPTKCAFSRTDIDLYEIADAPDSSPEEQLVRSEEGEQLRAAVDVLTRAIQTLSESERLYLTIVLNAGETPPSREIARLMQRPVEDIYRLKQTVLKRLRDLIAEDSAVKNWRASV